MLKHFSTSASIGEVWQPPSGGCVLKLNIKDVSRDDVLAAAFGRLCVETTPLGLAPFKPPAAAFGRLCVETYLVKLGRGKYAAAAFGRLCVET